MANLPISGLTASASNLASTDLAPVVQTVGVGPVKMTGAQIAAGLLSATTPIGSGPILSRGGSATLQLGAADVASGAAAQTLQVQSNTGAATTGPNFTIKGSAGTTAGGSIIFQTHNGTSYGNALTINSTAGGNGWTIGGGGGFSSLTSTNNIAQIIGLTSVAINPGAFYLGTSYDCALFRDGQPNTLALKNAGNAQIFRAYSTTTGPSYGYFAAGVTDAGVAAADTLFIGTGGAGAAMTKLALVVNGTSYLSFVSPGNATFAASLYIGAANYLGWNGRSLMSSPSNGVICLSTNSGENDTFGRLQFGGTTSSFPALKRSTTTLQVRLADDSAYANLAAAQLYSPPTALTSGATITWNANTSSVASLTLDQVGATLTMSNLVAGGTYLLIITQGTGGSKTITTWTNFRWPGGTAPVLSTTAGAIDVITAYSDGTYLYGSAQIGFA